jgi:hypothetical protein
MTEHLFISLDGRLMTFRDDTLCLVTGMIGLLPGRFRVVMVRDIPWNKHDEYKP